MRQIGLKDRSGGLNGERTRLKNQMRRLFSCSVQLVYTDADHEVLVHSVIADRAEFWWNTKQPDAPSLWDSRIELGKKFFQEIIAHPIPIDLHTLKGTETVAARIGLVPLDHLPDVQTQSLADPLVATVVPPVRRGPGEGWREIHRPQLPL